MSSESLLGLTSASPKLFRLLEGVEEVLSMEWIGVDREDVAGCAVDEEGGILGSEKVTEAR